MFAPLSSERWGRTYRERRTRASLTHGRDVEGGLVVRVNESVGPALGHDLVLGPEAHAFLTVLADVAEAGALPPAEAMVGDRHRDRHVDPDHADVDARGEFAGGVAVAGEDGDAVAVLVLRRQLQRLLEVWC